MIQFNPPCENLLAAFTISLPAPAACRYLSPEPELLLANGAAHRDRTEADPWDYYARRIHGRVIVPVRMIFCCISIIAASNCSGRGGQPGTYMSTGMKRSTPCTTA